MMNLNLLRFKKKPNKINKDFLKNQLTRRNS